MLSLAGLGKTDKNASEFLITLTGILFNLFIEMPQGPTQSP